MLAPDFGNRRRSERRRHIARCTHHTLRAGVPDKCIEPALWRCTGCGQLNCKRHRIQLEHPSICNRCTNATMMRFTERRASRRKEEPRIFAAG
jgi:hypothetical protein